MVGWRHSLSINQPGTKFFFCSRQYCDTDGFHFCKSNNDRQQRPSSIFINQYAPFSYSILRYYV
jgi:hypothetical protein